MSDPGTTYRTREEIQRMRSTQDPIRGLQRYIEEWGLASEEDLKVRSQVRLYCKYIMLKLRIATETRQGG